MHCFPSNTKKTTSITLTRAAIAASLLSIGSVASAASAVSTAATPSSVDAALASPFGAAPKNVAAAAPVAAPALAHYPISGVFLNREEHEKKMRQRQLSKSATTAVATSNVLTYGGGLVNGSGYAVTSGTPKVYVVVYGSQWGSVSTDANGNLTLSNDPKRAVPYIQNMFKDLGTGAERWSATMTQYCDGPMVAAGATSCPDAAAHVGFPGAGVLAGVWYDNAAPAPLNATRTDLDNEALRAAAHFGNNTLASNRYNQYIILSPTGTHPDGFGAGSIACAWHSMAAPLDLSQVVAYTNMPYVSDVGNCGTNFVNSGAAGALDGFSIVVGHEYAETLTNMYPRVGWMQGADENGDLCSWIDHSKPGGASNVTMARGTYAMQSTWSNDTARCDISHLISNPYNLVVEQLYNAYVGRPADTGALVNFTNALKAANAAKTLVALNTSYSTNVAVKAMIDNLGNSAESKALYPSVDTATFVNSIFFSLFNRNPEIAGQTYWVGEINSGHVTRAQAPMAIMAGALLGASTDAATVMAKAAVATNFTAAIDSQVEVTAFAGSNAALQARQMIAKVSNTTDVNAFQPTVDATLASIVASH